MEASLPVTVTLRAPEPKDVDMLYRLENEPYVQPISWGEAPVSRQMIWDYLQNYSADPYRDRQLRLIICADGEPCGACDISDLDPANRRAMAGIAVFKEWQSQGIATQALQQLISLCAEQLGLHQLAAIVPKSNAASLALFSKLKFKTAGCLRSWLKCGPRYEDAVVLQLIFRG